MEAHSSSRGKNESKHRKKESLLTSCVRELVQGAGAPLSLPQFITLGLSGHPGCVIGGCGAHYSHPTALVLPAHL